MENMSISQAVAMAMLAIIFAGITAESSVTCADVGTKLSSCLGYAQNGGTVSGECCGGVKGLKTEAATAEDRRAACMCIKTFVQKIPGIKQDLMAGIPDKCGVSINFPISFSVDCSR
ncbi:Stigma/stylar cysteine-rich adhesin [Platanthera guangdongensis]|uniref:Non-specific lipid-transfer protein n=1 Tax=Platanthera guangdongensis TaxID=2320717 RepID=A0ABR2MZ80_9ASPA